MIKRYVFCGVALAALAAPAVLVAQSSSDFRVVAVHIDNTRNATTIFDTAEQCYQSEKCMRLVEMGSKASGWPLDKIVAVGGALSGSRNGEGTYMTIALPVGYSYCSATIQGPNNEAKLSVVPNDGPRGSTFLARADASSLYVETWTPQLGPFDGSSWVEGDVSVIGVRNELAAQAYASGRCQEPKGRIIFYCRGGGCVNTRDTGQSVSPSPAPPANGSN